MKKILIFMGNPDTDSYSARIADAYGEGARSAGHEVIRVNLSDMNFDPALHKGYKEIQELEPDLVMMQERIKEVDHIVFVYPNWWCTMPAAMKGMFDRMWLPGFAFNFDKVNNKLVQRLTGKTARVIVIAGTHSPFMTWWKFGDYTNELVHGILGFAGIKAKTTALGPTNKASEELHEKWAEKIRKMGEKAQ